MHSNIIRPQSVASSGNHVPMNAAQAFFHYNNSPNHRAMTPSYHAPSTPPPYSPPRSTTLTLSPSSSPPSSSPLARQHALIQTKVTIPGPVPKARNAFIIYRSHFISSGKAKGVRLQNDISRLAADSWKAMCDSDKEEWKQKAAEEKRVRDEMAKALEVGYMLSPSKFVSMPIRAVPNGKKAQAKKDMKKAAAVAAAQKRENESAKRADRRKDELKKLSPLSLPSRTPSVSPIHLPKLIHSSLAGPEPSTSSTEVPQAPSSLVSSAEPFIVDPYTFQSHTYDSPLDSDQRNASPIPANFQRVAGAIQVIDPSTHTLLAPALPPLGDFQRSIENPWLGSRDMFAGIQRVPGPSVQLPMPNIQLSKALRASALARKQGQVVWPRDTMHGRSVMPCIDPRMLGANGALPSLHAVNSSAPTPTFSVQTPLTNPLADPFNLLPTARNASSPSVSPVTPEDVLPSPFAAPHSYSFSRTPSPFGMPDTSYIPSNDTYLYNTGFDTTRSDNSVPLSKTVIANKQGATTRVTISTPQTDANNEWANFGAAASEGDWQWLAAAGAQTPMPGSDAGYSPEADFNLNVFGQQDLSNMNMMGLGMGFNSTAM